MNMVQWTGPGWTIAVDDTALTASWDGDAVTVTAVDAGGLAVRRRWVGRCLNYCGRPLLRLRGSSRSDVAYLRRAIKHLSLTPQITAAVGWYQRVGDVRLQATATQRWVPTETLDDLLTSRPPQGLLARVRAAGTEGSLTELQRSALEFLDVDLEQAVASTNETVMDRELLTRRKFFDTIEKSPLTDEQARGVACFDNRVQVLAAAGSGKTSVMVARAAYAVARGFVRPERILLLAFNRAAAIELQKRVEARFATADIDSTGIRASTFHSFGLDVIARATGTKPRLASWLEVDDGLEMITHIVDELRDRDEQFRYNWDLYRLLFARAPIKIEESEPDAWDAGTNKTGYRTFGGNVVRSHGERLIADFLFFNGVTFDYERPYSHHVGDATHPQYRPDFYYPEIDVWHEHWALDREGKPPASFHGYTQSMEWKRRTHARYGTALIETTFAGVLWGDDLYKLRDELICRGLALDWNPDRKPVDEWVKPLRHEDLHRLMRTFMSHVKSNSWTAETLERRLDGDLRHLAGQRTRLFLKLYWAIATEWERRLAREGAVDFEDMLVQAAGHLEAGRADLGYELVMVDEFQDASRARARVVRGLLSKAGRYLLAVGDDWQSINRFAGADVSVMTEFAAWFGRGPQLALTITFRCSQAICDVASSFISKNPRQFTKSMRSSHTEPGIPIDVLRSDNAAAALASYLDTLSRGVAAGTVPVGPSGTVTVNVLGRYHHEDKVMPDHPPGNLEVTFRTVHAAKGLEADYIVVPGMTTGTYGFPSTITDDPVLQLAMPAPDTYEHAEERRLFYVALTRARQAVTLITHPNRMSPFVVELLDAGQVTLDGQTMGAAVNSGVGSTSVQVCPVCKKGTLVQKNGRYGAFLGCSTFPSCRYTRSLKPNHLPR